MEDDEVRSKKDFDLEIVHRGFKDCLTDDGTIHLAPYLDAFTELSRLFKLAGKVFLFTARDLDRKLAIIRTHMAAENGDKYDTVQSMLAYEIRCQMTHRRGRLPSGTRTLLRLQQALEFTVGFLKELADSDDQTRVRPLACAVYRRTLYKHQSKPVRKIAAAMMYLLPKRRRLVEVMCKHDPDEAIRLIGQVVQVAAPAYERIYELYRSNDLLDIP